MIQSPNHNISNKLEESVMEFVDKGSEFIREIYLISHGTLAVSILTNSKKENYARTTNNYLQSWRH
jgi:hypothetical protein